MSFRQMVYDAGVSGAQISRALGRNETWVRERLRSHRQFSFDEMKTIATLVRVPVARLYNVHIDEFQAAGLSDDRRQINRLWSAEEDATLRRYAERGMTIPDVAKALARSYSATFSRATRLGVHFSRAESGAAREMIAQQVGAAAKPMRPADEEAVAALYAKYGNYGGDTSKPGTLNPTFMPHRPMTISACGSTAQMCVEFAR